IVEVPAVLTSGRADGRRDKSGTGHTARELAHAIVAESAARTAESSFPPYRVEEPLQAFGREGFLMSLFVAGSDQRRGSWVSNRPGGDRGEDRDHRGTRGNTQRASPVHLEQVERDVTDQPQGQERLRGGFHRTLQRVGPEF